jgi:hypothetical protein
LVPCKATQLAKGFDPVSYGTERSARRCSRRSNTRPHVSSKVEEDR